MVLIQNRYGDQCNKTKGPNMVHVTPATQYLTKTRRTQIGEKCLLQMELAQLGTTRRRILYSYLSPCTKSNSEWIKDPAVETAGRKHRQCLPDTGVGKGFLNSLLAQD